VVRVPVTQPTGCTFVGPALDILVVTTAVERLSDVDRVGQPDAGPLFTVHVPDVVGWGTSRYRGPLGSLTAA
jgi:sugar lactone lactonase YvrE